MLSGALPPFYTGIYKCDNDDETGAYRHYQLPYDIYWFSRQKSNIDRSNVPKFDRRKPNKLTSTISYRETVDKTLTHTEHPTEEFADDQQRLVRQTSIFLVRNCRRVNDKRRCQRHDRSLSIDDRPPIFLTQNYYHPKSDRRCPMSNTLTHRGKTRAHITISMCPYVHVRVHLELLCFFVNHIRRSQFAKLAYCSTELVDDSCRYAQLAQLTYILNQLFESILTYKCHKSDVYPSNALKKCPSKHLFPIYYELIRQPIDLTRIRQKLDAGEYLSYQSFENDLVLLFVNAIVRKRHTHTRTSLADEYDACTSLSRAIADKNPMLDAPSTNCNCFFFID
jgi:hypothetical protein